jgi:trigger factor
MQVTATLNEGLKRGYTITVSAAELDAKVQEKLVEAQPEVEMKGFRKGKVPMAMLRKQFGPRLMGDAMQEVIDSAMKSHFDTSGDRPALQPEVKMVGGESWSEGQDVVVEMQYEALPAIPEVDCGSLVLERLVVSAEPAAVAEALDSLARSAQSFEDRAEGASAVEGDQVTIDFKGTVDGAAFEGGEAEDYPLVLGAGTFLPGFDEQLRGVRAGDEVTVTVGFPENYGVKQLAGKTAAFAVRVKAVRAPKPADLDDDLAQKYGAENLEALKGQIAARLEAEYMGAARAVLKRALLDQLDRMVDFDLPASLVEAEANQIAHQLYHEEHPEDHGHDHGAIAPTEEHHKLAVRRVRLGLLLAEIGRKDAITVTDAEMTQAVLAQARQYRGQERQFFEFVQKNPQVQQQLRAPIFEDKVVDHILAAAQVTEKPAARDELQKAVAALDEL